MNFKNNHPVLAVLRYKDQLIATIKPGEEVKLDWVLPETYFTLTPRTCRICGRVDSAGGHSHHWTTIDECSPHLPEATLPLR